jgi:preprotein translocase subunit YajC
VQALVPFLLIIVVFWFFLIRPQTKRQREAQQMQAALTPDSNVMLTSGVFGTVREITDDYVLVEIADNVAIKVVRAAIGRVIPDEIDEPEVENAEPVEAVSDVDPVEHVEPAESVEHVEPLEPREKD